MVIKNKIWVSREQTDFENVRTFVDIEIAVQFMIFITFETRSKTCSKIENSLFLLVQWVAKKGRMSEKMIIILIYLSNNSPYAATICSHTA